MVSRKIANVAFHMDTYTDHTLKYKWDCPRNLGTRLPSTHYSCALRGKPPVQHPVHPRLGLEHGWVPSMTGGATTVLWARLRKCSFDLSILMSICLPSLCRELFQSFKFTNFRHVKTKGKFRLHGDTTMCQTAKRLQKYSMILSNHCILAE